MTTKKQIIKENLERKDVVIGKKQDDSVKSDSLDETIKRIKDAKRVQMQEDQENRDTDNVSADNANITAKVGVYGNPQNDVDDFASTDQAKVTGVDTGSDQNKEQEEVVKTDASFVPTEADATVPVAVKEEEDPDADSIKETVAKIREVVNPNSLDTTVESQENRDTDNVSADNAKIVAGKDKVSKPAAVAEEAVEEQAVEEDAEITSSEFNAKGPAKDTDDPETYLTTEDFDISEDLAAIFGDSKGLSEAFKEKTKSIFEAAIVAKANQVVKEALRIMREDLKSHRQTVSEQMETKLNDYLNVIVEEWAENNKQTLVENAKYDTTQAFMTDIKVLFEKHNIEVPKGKENIFEKVLEENIKLEDKNNALVEEKVEILKTVKKIQKSNILAESSNGLSLNQKTKLKMLSEAIEFTNEGDFRKKLTEIKDAYFAPKKGSIEKSTTPVETLVEEKAPVQDDDAQATAAAISKYAK